VVDEDMLKRFLFEFALRADKHEVLHFELDF